MSARDFEDDMLFTSPSLGQEPAFDVDLLRVISAARSAVTSSDPATAS